MLYGVISVMSPLPWLNPPPWMYTNTGNKEFGISSGFCANTKRMTENDVTDEHQIMVGYLISFIYVLWGYKCWGTDNLLFQIGKNDAILEPWAFEGNNVRFYTLLLVYIAVKSLVWVLEAKIFRINYEELAHCKSVPLSSIICAF